ncbi:MAG: PQQ-dependent sugar dehydrogenase [Gammaproteobacteria bacterium]|nr:PQQ-dependent sugar dehydrogenase [Gammaproteobacteria bacterium]
MNEMPGWSGILPETEIRRLAIHVSERRDDIEVLEYGVGASFAIPEGTVRSALHDFRIETVVEALDPLPYCIPPLPDRRFLLTEKKRGLCIVSADGVQSPLVEGTPAAHADSVDLPFTGLELGGFLGRASSCFDDRIAIRWRPASADHRLGSWDTIGG